MLNSFGNNLNIIKSKPTGLFCTFSTSAAKRVTVKSRSRAEEQLCVGVQTSAPGRGNAPGDSQGPVQGLRVSAAAGRDTEPLGANSWSTPSSLEGTRGTDWNVEEFARTKQKEKMTCRQQVCDSMASNRTDVDV